MAPSSALRRKLTVSVSLLASAHFLNIPAAAQYDAGTRVYRVAYVAPSVPSPSVDVFRARMRELGYVEGKNFVFDA